MEYNHLSQLIQCQADKFGEEEVLKVQDHKTGTWISISWNEFLQKSKETAQAMCRFGILPQQNIGVYSQNMVECLYLDFGAFFNRVTTVPMYATASIPQISYMIREAEIELLFVGEQSQYDHAIEAQKNNNILKQIVILDSKVKRKEDDKSSLYFSEFCASGENDESIITAVKKRTREGKKEDIAHLIYTSGTTGESKGVMLSHFNYIEIFRNHDLRLNYLPQRFSSISFLPMAHIFEKAWSLFCLHRGCSIAINLDPREIQTNIKEVRPQAMCSVPRFWEKVYAGVQERIDNSGPVLRRIFLDAIATGRRYNLDYVNKQKKPPFLLKLKFNFYDKTVFTMLKKVVGIENGLIFPCAGSFLSEKITEFMRSVNIPIVIGYGLTETTATVSCFSSVDYELGTVGKVMPGVEVRIGENDEIQVKGFLVMQGYYKKPEITKEVFTEDGWFRTGDAGKLTEKNGIILTERIKDLYKTSNGKYIAPQQLEGRLMDDKYIEGAIIIADQRKYVTALIIPDFVELEKFAKNSHISFFGHEDLVKNEKIVALYESQIKAIQHEFANYEQIKRFSLLAEPFTIAGGELTNTLKMRRAFIAQKHKEIIDNMYPAD